VSLSRITGDLTEFDIMDQRIIEYLNEILKNINMAQEKIEKKLDLIIVPEFNQIIVLLLRNEEELNIKLSNNLSDFILFAERLLRVEERKKKKYERARAKYKAWALRLLKEAGYTNEQKLLMSFASRLQKMIKKKEINEKEIVEEYLT